MDDSLKRQKYTRLGLDLLSLLAEEGKRIFTMKDVQERASIVGLSESSIRSTLHRLKQGGWIIALRRGLFMLDKSFVHAPIHEFEIATALVSPAIISFWSAMNYHGMTEQIPRPIFILTSSNNRLPTDRGGKFGTCVINGVPYTFVRMREERLFGYQKVWVGESRVNIADPERTLLDGLIHPELCGGFDEVIYVFQNYKNRLNTDKIIEYALRLDKSTQKRLGWILAKLNFSKSKLQPLRRVKRKSYVKLDPLGPAKGKCCIEWMIQENLYE